MVIPQKYIDNFTRLLNGISEDAKRRMTQALQRITLDDIAVAREEIIAAMNAILGPYCKNAAALSATFYDGLRELFGISDGFTAEAISSHDPKATEGAVRSFMRFAVDDNAQALSNALLGRIDYELKKTANECVEQNAIRDPKKPKWARIPTGAETCAFCIMLASRGFDYNSKETASHAHANCDCRIVPSWDKDPRVENYGERLDEYRQKYERADELRRGDMPEELRERIEAAKAEHNERYRNGQEDAPWSSRNEITMIMRYQNPGMH